MPACREEMGVRARLALRVCGGLSDLGEGILEAVAVTALHIGGCQHCIQAVVCWADGIWAVLAGAGLMRVCRAAPEPLWLHLLPFARAHTSVKAVLLKHFCIYGVLDIYGSRDACGCSPDCSGT